MGNHPTLVYEKWPLTITSLDRSGKISGTIFEGGALEAFEGTWNEQSGVVSFVVCHEPDACPIKFTGYLIREPAGSVGSILYTLVGYADPPITVSGASIGAGMRR